MKKLLFLIVFSGLSSFTLRAQWIAQEGPYGGYVYQMKANDTYVFATKGNGLFRSGDVGLNWEKCDSIEEFGRISIDGPNILAGYIRNNLGLFRYSADNGDHWENVALPAGTPYVDNFAVKGNILLFNYLSKIWRSTDLGQNWQTFVLPNEPAQNNRLLGTFEGQLYLGNQNRLFTSDDGLNWTYLATVPGNSNSSMVRLFKQGDVMISLCGQTVGRSVDAGMNWFTGAVEGNLTLGPNTEFTYENGIFYASSGIPMVKSVNNGLSWEIINPNNPKYYYHTSLNNVILGHLFGLGIFRSTDGGQTFTPSNHGLFGSDVQTLGLQNNDLWLWDERGIVRQNANQLDWEAPLTYPLPTLNFSFVSILPFKNAVFVRKDHGDLLRSFDSGQNWTTVTPDPSIVSSDFIKFRQKNDSLFISGATYKTYLSSDFGDHWELINTYINSQIGGAMNDMIIQGNRYFVTDNLSIYRSLDHMHTWDQVGGPNPFNTNLGSLRLFSTPRFLFAFVNKAQVFRSDDQGETWTEIALPFPTPFNVSEETEITFNEIGNVVVAFFERAGIFVSYDNGQNWFPFNQGIASPQSTSSFVFDDTSLWVGCNDFGLYRRPTAELKPLSIALPNAEILQLEIYPNPTQGTFNYSLPKGVSGETSLLIYDMQGRLVLHPTSTAHQRDIDLHSFSKGLYWVNLITEKGTFNGKLILD